MSALPFVPFFKLSLQLLALIVIVFAVDKERQDDFHHKHHDHHRHRRRPNFLILIADDMGYGDLFSYGHQVQEFNAIDQMAREGILFRQFYSADCLCTPSRSGLMTGRLPIRTGVVPRPHTLNESISPVFDTSDIYGLPAQEITLAEALSDLGYHTGMVGKWHLGINAYTHDDGTYLPGKNGFQFVGHNLPFTNVMMCDETGIFMPNGPDPNYCFVYYGSEIIQQPMKHEYLADKLLRDFDHFLDKHAHSEHPFFFYFSFPHVHTSLFSSPRFANTSYRGLYGDALSEMAWTIGEVLNRLKREHIAEDTLVVFMSDHGPHVEACEQGGITGHFKGGKANTWEGGYRVPAIAWWPGVIEAGQVSDVVLSSLDIWPTFVSLAGGHQPQHQKLDGQDETDNILGFTRKQHKDKTIFYYCGAVLIALRYRDHKFHFKNIPVASDELLELRCPGGIALEEWYMINDCQDLSVTVNDPPVVYDLLRDPYENFPLNATGDYVAHLLQEVKAIVADHEASLAKHPAKPIMGYYNTTVIPCCNYPECRCNYP